MVSASDSKTATAEAKPDKGSRGVNQTGGYKDRPWFLRFWNGMLFGAWIRVLARNRFRVSPRRIGMAVILLWSGVFNSVLSAVQSLIFGRKIARTRIEHAPLFIIGHWRSGTTMLHEIMVLDERHTYPDTYACYAPNHFVMTRGCVPRMLWFMLPRKRPMDNVEVGWDRPQEDEFALCNMGIPSPYHSWMFPNIPHQYPEYMNMDGVPPKALEQWKQALLWFLKCLTLINPKRIVLKSPPHTGRVRVLKELFPDAKFVHIVRDPHVLFASTVHLWKRLSRDEGLQTPTYEGLEEEIFERFDLMYAAYRRDRSLLGPNQLSEVRYEDLVKDPIGEMRRIYEELDLGEFDRLLPALEQYTARHSDYKRNRYEIAPETRAEIARRWKAYMDEYGYASEE